MICYVRYPGFENWWRGKNGECELMGGRIFLRRDLRRILFEWCTGSWLEGGVVRNGVRDKLLHLRQDFGSHLGFGSSIRGGG